MHGVPVKSLAVMPWGDYGLEDTSDERRELVPDNIKEITFDAPTLVRVTSKP